MEDEQSGHVHAGYIRAGQTFEVYVPVAVTVEVLAGGGLKATGAAIEWDGAPWMFTTTEANVWPTEADPDGDQNWLRADVTEAADPLNDVVDAAEAALLSAFSTATV